MKNKQLSNSDVRGHRSAILAHQDGKCLICKKEPTAPVLDHSHQKKNKGTGLVRGVLCSNCNVLLAKMENNAPRYGVPAHDLPLILSNMSTYLLRPHYPLIHPSERPKRLKLKRSSYLKLVSKSRNKCPDFPKQGYITAPLSKAFEKWEIKPEFYQ